MNPQEVFLTTTSLAIMGIVVDMNKASFSIEKSKLDEIHGVCLQAFL